MFSQIIWSAVELYWVTSVAPSLGPTGGKTVVTVAGVNFNAMGGNVNLMRCRFGSQSVTASFALGQIVCSRFAFFVSTYIIYCSTQLTRVCLNDGVCAHGAHGLIAVP